MSVDQQQQLSLKDMLAQESEGGIDINQLYRQILRYKILIIVVTLTSIALGYAFTSLIRPEYTTSASVQVEQLNDAKHIGAGAVVNRRSFQETQLQRFRSRALAKRVAESLELTKNPEFTGELDAGGVGSLFTAVKSFFSEQPDDAQVIMPAREVSVDAVVGQLASQTEMTIDRSTGVISVTVNAFDPHVAAAIANAYVDNYIELHDDDEAKERERLQGSLGEALRDVQLKIGEAERKLAEFERETDAIDLEDNNNVVSQRLRDLTSEFLAAQKQRIELESRFKFGDLSPEEIDASDSVQRSIQSSVANTESDEDVRQLQADAQLEQDISWRSPLFAEYKHAKAKKVRILAELENLSEIYKPAHPKIRELNAELNEVEKSLQVQRQEQLDALEKRYNAAYDKERTLQTQVKAQNDLLLTIRENSLQHNIMKRELEGLKSLHVGMLERIKSSGVSSELNLTRFTVIQSANPPGSPSSPNMINNVGIAGLLGLMGSLGFAFVLTFMDRRIRTPEELSEISAFPNLSVVPKLVESDIADLDAPLEIATFADTSGILSESFRSLRTSLIYSLPNGLPKSMMITSSSPGEGKTTTIINLALTIKKTEAKRILIMDLDLRKPRQHKVFGYPISPGLNDVIEGQQSELVIHNLQKLDMLNRFTGSELNRISPNYHKGGLYLLTAGSPTQNPVELLESDEFDQLYQQLANQFDIILIDAPPVMGLSDSLVLSTRCEAVLLVVSSEVATQDSVKDSIKKLTSVNANVVGTVMSKFDTSQEKYGYSGKYNQYYYEYGTKES